MRTLLAALAATTMLAASAIAADEGPSYEKGAVWDFTQIQTKDGHFDDYMKWVSTDWKAQEEAMKKAGYIVDYKVFLVTDPRDNEPDIVLGVESKNMAAFDHSSAEEYAMQAKIAGSIAKADQEQAARGSIRTIRGDVMMREVTLK
jgi:hypothetical protein